MGVGELVEEARLSHPRLAHHRDDLAVPGAGALESEPKLLHLGVPPNEAGEAAYGSRLEPGLHARRTGQLVDLDGARESLDCHPAKGLYLHIVLYEPQRVRGQHDRVGRRHLLHPCGKMSGLPDGGVVHPQITAD
jgi:hypothetical protein